MIRLANFTLHKMDDQVQKWSEMGFELDPEPRAPLVLLEDESWTEERIVDAVREAIVQIKDEGFNAIIIGGLSNEMAYAWFFASSLGLRAIMAKTPRKRLPSGKPYFELVGYTEMFRPDELTI